MVTLTVFKQVLTHLYLLFKMTKMAHVDFTCKFRSQRKPHDPIDSNQEVNSNKYLIFQHYYNTSLLAASNLIQLLLQYLFIKSTDENMKDQYIDLSFFFLSFFLSFFLMFSFYLTSHRYYKKL